MQKWKIEKDKRRYNAFSFSFFFFFVLFHIARTKKSFTFHESIFNTHDRNKSASFSSLTRKTMKIILIKQKYNSILSILLLILSQQTRNNNNYITITDT